MWFRYSYAHFMEIHLTPELEAHLHQIAQHEGKTAEDLMIDAARNMSEDDLRIREIIRERVKKADEGIFIEQEEMDARIEKMLSR